MKLIDILLCFLRSICFLVSVVWVRCKDVKRKKMFGGLLRRFGLMFVFLGVFEVFIWGFKIFVLFCYVS